MKLLSKIKYFLVVLAIVILFMLAFIYDGPVKIATIESPKSNIVEPLCNVNEIEIINDSTYKDSKGNIIPYIRCCRSYEEEMEPEDITSCTCCDIDLATCRQVYPDPYLEFRFRINQMESDGGTQ